MTLEIEAQWKKYRDEKLLPLAIEEQKQNDGKRRISAYLLGGGALFAIATAAAMAYIEKRYGIQIFDTWLEVAIGLPACTPAALGLMGVLMFQGNSVMELTQVSNDTYVPKEP
jgi:hypothetical protein